MTSPTFSRQCQNECCLLNHRDHGGERRIQRTDNELFKLRDLRESSVHSVVKLYFDTASTVGEVTCPIGKINMNLHIKKILGRPAGVFLFFVVFSVALRFFSFFPSVLDHDESTYLEIAREMLGGKVLYVDLIDIKPPGIFWLYALFQIMFGHSIFMMRLLTALFIAGTSFMIYLFDRQMFESQRAGIAGGLIYIFFVSTWSRYGISPNTEVFFNFFTMAGLYVLIKREHWQNYLSGGILAGLGFIIKYLVLFDLAAFLLFFFLVFLRHPTWKDVRRLATKFALIILGFGLPFALVNAFFF